MQKNLCDAGAPAVATDLAALLDAQVAAYAPDVCWSAPRRNLTLSGRDAVRALLEREAAAMAGPRVTPLRRTAKAARTFDEYCVRFRMQAPGIDGLDLPVGAEVELERLRVLTHDARGLVVQESSIETWTWLPAATTNGSPER